MVSFLDLQMNHVKERFEDEKNKEVLFMCIGITSGVGRLLFGRIADYVPGLKKVYLQVLYTLFPYRRRLTCRSFTLSVPYRWRLIKEVKFGNRKLRGTNLLQIK